MLAVSAGFLLRNLTPPPRPEGIAVVPRELPGGLRLVLPEGALLENEGYALAGRMGSADQTRGVRAQASWNEAQGVGAKDLAEIHHAWLDAVTASRMAPAMGAADAVTCAGHPGVRARGVTGDAVEYRAITWACPASHRVVHVLLSAPVGLDLGAGEEALRTRSACHALAAVDAGGPRARLPAAPGWNEVKVTGTRRSYAGPGGLVDVVVEEGPAPQGSVVEHVMAHPELWPALLTGVVGRPMPVATPGAEKAKAPHDAVRVHGKLQPPASGSIAPLLFVETTIWVCPETKRLVSVSAVSPDKTAIERARPVLDAARCH